MNKLKAFWANRKIETLLTIWFALTIWNKSTESAIILGCGMVAVAITVLANTMAPVYTCDTGGMNDTDEPEAPYKLEPKE